MDCIPQDGVSFQVKKSNKGKDTIVVSCVPYLDDHFYLYFEYDNAGVTLLYEEILHGLSGGCILKAISLTFDTFNELSAFIQGHALLYQLNFVIVF